MRALFTFFAFLCLMAAMGMAVIDREAVQFTLDRLATRGTDTLLSFDDLSLSLPVGLTARGVTLTDPATGLPVAWSELLEAELAWQLTQNPPARVTLIRGRGGKLTVSRDEQGSGLERAIQALFGAFRRSRPAGQTRAPVPPQAYEGVEVTFVARGMELETIRDCTIRINDVDGLILIDATMGEHGGHITASLDETGLRAMEVIKLRITPSMAALIPGDNHQLADRLRPSGLLDMTLGRDAQGNYTAHGTLSEASLSPGRLPAVLENATLPFRIRDGHFLVEDAELHLAGGPMRGSLDWTPESMTAHINLEGAEFRSVFVDYLSGQSGLERLRFRNGGNIDLKLDLLSGPGFEDLQLHGTGGFHIHEMGVVAAGQVVPVSNVVGAFQAEGKMLTFGMLSKPAGVVAARTWSRKVSGRCGGGELGFAGTLARDTRALDMSVWVSDVNLKGLFQPLQAWGGPKPELGAPGPEDGPAAPQGGSQDDAQHPADLSNDGAPDLSKLGGWLQGHVRYFNAEACREYYANHPDAPLDLNDPRLKRRGRGRVALRGIDVRSFDLGNRVMQEAGESQSDDRSADWVEARFDIRKNKLELHDNGLKITSGAITLMGDGRVTMKGGLDLKLVLGTVRAGPIGKLMRYVERNFYQIEVDGTLSDPIVVHRPLEGITGGIDSFLDMIFGKGG